MELTTIELIKDILLDVHKTQAVIQADQAAMKADLANHMRRTAISEERLNNFENYVKKENESLKRDIWYAKGAVGLVVLALSIYKIFKG